MIPLHGRNIGPEHIGRIIADGYEIVWVLDQPLYPHGASMHLRHTETEKWSLLDCGPDDTVWLQTDTIPPTEPPHRASCLCDDCVGDLVDEALSRHRPPDRWVEIAHDVAEEVASA